MADQMLIVTAQGLCLGAVVKLHLVHPEGDVVEVQFTDARGPYKPGDVASYLRTDLRLALEPGELVAYDPAYLRRNNADMREYKRRARVVGRREGALVALEWEDGQGPQTDSTLHLVRL